MFNNYFEEQMRKKMEKLRFTPSDPVWYRIDAAIQKDKKRKKWLLLSILLIGTAVSGRFLLPVFTNDVVAAKKNNLPSLNRAIGASPKVLPGNNNQTIRVEKCFVKPRTTESVLPLENRKIPTQAFIANAAIKHAKKADFSFFPEAPLTDNKKGRGLPHQTIAASNTYLPHFIVEEERLMKQVTAGIVWQNDITGQNAEIPVLVRGPDSSVFPTMSDQKTRQENPVKTHPWLLYAQVSAGKSGLYRSFEPIATLGIRPQNKYLDDDATRSLPPAQPKPILPRPKFSAKLGVTAIRAINKRSSIRAGLSYSLYNTEIVAGNLINTNQQLFPLYASYAGGGTNIATSSSYYANGSNKTYNNQYHFLQLPIVFSRRLSKQGHLPIEADIGLFANYLLASNALEYSPTSGVFYNNKNTYHKFQVGTHAGVSVTLFSKTNHAVRIGPDIDFAFTSLLKQAGPQQLKFTYVGIGTSFLLPQIPDRKRKNN